jgi:hypothetical protein
MQIPLILRQFQDATNTAEDAPRPPEKPPKPVEQLKSGSQASVGILPTTLPDICCCQSQSSDASSYLQANQLCNNERETQIVSEAMNTVPCKQLQVSSPGGGAKLGGSTRWRGSSSSSPSRWR